MKFLMFADLHYHPGVLYGASWEMLHAMQQRALENECDFMIHAGDFCYGPSLVADFVEAYNNFSVPGYHCLGNHDCDKTPYEETLNYFNMPNGYYYFDCKGYRIIVLDSNYYKDGDRYVHYNLKNNYAHPADRDQIPPEQLAWLRQTIENAPHPCLIISHASFERECVIPKDHTELLQLSNEANASIQAQDIRQMIRQINAVTPHKVLMVMNGHHHRDFLRILDNVLYWDVNSTAYDWVCDNPHDRFPEDLTREHSLIAHTVVYNDPLCAVVTVEGTTITIEGTESSMFMGVTREMVGDIVLDRSGRPTTPRIQSAKLTLL